MLRARRRRGAGQRALRRRPALAGRPRPPPRRGDPDRDVTLTATERIFMTLSLSNHLAADSARRSAAPRRPRRAAPDAEVVAAQVVLRLGGQRPVRPDHPAAGVLPDPRRGADPARARGRRSPRPSGADTLVELGSGTSEKTRMLLRRAARRGIPAPVHPVRRRRRRAARPRAPRSARSTPASRSTRSCGDFEEHLGKIPTRRPPTGRRSSGRPSAT